MRALLFPQQSYRPRPRAGFVLLCIFLLIAMWGCGGNISNKKYYEGEGDIQGQFFLPSGQPAAGARIMVVNLPSLVTTTDAQGKFRLNRVPVGKRDLVIIHPKGFGRRFQSWLVRDNLIELKPEHQELQVAGTIVGRVQSTPRFGNKGIVVQLKGIFTSTKTYNQEGEFRLAFVAPGCHTLQVQTALFKTRQLPELCVTPGQTLHIPEAIRLIPSKACEQDGADCDKTSVCHQGYCVPDQGGVARVLRPQINLDAVPIQQKRTFRPALLTNAGQGRLKLTEITLKSNHDHFSIETQGVPVVLDSQETFALPITFNASKPGVYYATLDIRTNDPEKAQLQIALQARVETYQTQCLQTKPTALKLGDLTLGQPSSFEVEVFNRCGRTLKITSFQGQFPQPVLFTARQQTPVHVLSGQSLMLRFQLAPQSYGFVQGVLQIEHNESNASPLYIPVEGNVPTSNVQVSSSGVTFGHVPPGHTHTQWLRLELSKPGALDQLEFSFRAGNQNYFRAKAELVRRNPNKFVYYLPLQFTAPLAGSAQQSAWMEIKNLPGLQEQSYMIQLKGAMAPPRAPVVPALLDIGHTDHCTSRPRTLELFNNSEQPIQLSKLTLQSETSKDFSVTKTTTTLLEPNERKSIAKIQFIPSAPQLKTFARLKVELRQEGVSLAPQYVALQAASGVRHADTFPRATQNPVQLFIHLERGLDQTKIKQSLLDLMTQLDSKNINFDLQLLTRENSALKISTSTKDREANVQRMLQQRNNTQHLGLSLLYDLIRQKRIKQDRPTALLYFASQDDRSIYSTRHYLSAWKGVEPLSLFAATSHGGCGGAQGTPRYRQAAASTGGASLDLCKAGTTQWQAWKQQIYLFLSGKQRTFPLSRSPQVSSIQVYVDQRVLPTDQWKYSRDTNSVTLQLPSFTEQNNVTLRYYTACQ